MKSKLLRLSQRGSLRKHNKIFRNCITVAAIGVRMLALAFSPLLMGGLVLFGFSILAWLVVLSRLPVSIAYPMASLGYVVAALLGVVFLREPVHVLQIVGIVVICLGVGLIARPAVP